MLLGSGRGRRDGVGGGAWLVERAVRGWMGSGGEAEAGMAGAGNDGNDGNDGNASSACVAGSAGSAGSAGWDAVAARHRRTETGIGDRVAGSAQVVYTVWEQAVSGLVVGEAS